MRDQSSHPNFNATVQIYFPSYTYCFGILEFSQFFYRFNRFIFTVSHLNLSLCNFFCSKVSLATKANPDKGINCILSRSLL